MNRLLFVSFYCVIFVMVVGVFSSLASTNIKDNVLPRIRLFENFVNDWHNFENSVSTHYHDFINYFESNPAQAPHFNYDVTLVGFVNAADGIGRHPILFKDCLEKSATMNFVSTRDIPPHVEDMQLGLPRFNHDKKEDIGAISILTDIIGDKKVNNYKKVPDSLIKIAYSMFESTKIPPSWTQILNDTFDMVVVPDPFYVAVYKKCGVKIPIFVLSLPLMLDDFLKFELPTIQHTPFVFGMVGGFWQRKNHIRVLEAFAEEFGNRSDVKLRLHGRFGEEAIIKELADMIEKKNLKNVELIVGPYNSDEYLEFYKSLDCYILCSMGEGFSITPREALACGLPCIVTSNTAQITICNTDTVRPVSSDILVPAFYDCHDADQSFLLANMSKQFGREQLFVEEEYSEIEGSAPFGYQLDCTIADVRRAMFDVYAHYSEYLNKASRGREWVKRYLAENLRAQYINLVKPKSVVLGDENIIGDTFLMTNSKKLYEKYCSIVGGKILND